MCEAHADEYLFEGGVIRSRRVLDSLQLLQCCLVLLGGVQAEGALPYRSHPLREGPRDACGPGIVRRGRAFPLGQLPFLPVLREELKKAEHQSLALEPNEGEELLAGKALG